MPKPVGAGQRYLPGLDGLRALAVAAVVAYHLGLGWASGGLLGVGVFFTLSGYLITDILLGQWRSGGSLRLRNFWLRRARRLLPALFVLLAVVAVWVALEYPAQLQAVDGDIVAAAFYVSNWWFIAQGNSYFARFGPPSPVEHLWSLAVEEQFYLIWPWLVLAGGLLLTRWLALRPGRARATAIAVTLGLAAVSAIAMALLYHAGFDATRAYEGTDTRACGLLIGAALAMAWPTRRPAAVRASKGSGRSSGWRRIIPNAPGRLSSLALDLGGLAGLAVIGILIWRTGEYSAVMFRGGMVALSVATAAVIAAVAHPRSVLGRVLGAGPLRWLGVRSYGIYLWHYPLIVLTAPGGNPAGGAMSGTRQVLAAGGAVAAAAVSWAIVEEPVRSGTLPRLPRPVDGWARGAVSGGVLRAATAGAAALAVLAGAAFGASVLAGRGSAAPSDRLESASALSGNAVSGPGGGMSGGGGTLSGGRGIAGGAPGLASALAAGDRSVAAPGQAYVAGLPTAPLRTSCTSVVQIGDSTSEGLISSAYLPDPGERIPARYEQVGVRTVHMEISGARSIVEEYHNIPNAAMVAQRYESKGYHGCWVLALGTNDTADVAVGSPVGLAARIGRMMALLGNQPVLWVNVRSLLSSGPYSEHNMQLWDTALAAAGAKHPNMRVYDWAAVVKNQWFINDGIHFTSAGYAARAQMIADALAAAFPAY